MEDYVSKISDVKAGTIVYIWYLQLAIRSEQTCRSKGYNFKFIGHDNVKDILQCEEDV